MFLTLLFITKATKSCILLCKIRHSNCLKYQTKIWQFCDNCPKKAWCFTQLKHTLTLWNILFTISRVSTKMLESGFAMQNAPMPTAYPCLQHNCAKRSILPSFAFQYILLCKMYQNAKPKQGQAKKKATHNYGKAVMVCSNYAVAILVFTL